MDVEKLKKLNKLTKELQSQGFATSSQDAFQQAGGIYNEGIGDLGGSAPAPSNNAAQPAPEQQTSEVALQGQGDAFFEKRMELVLEANNKKYAEQIEALKGVIQMLNDEMTMLKHEVKRIAENATQAAIAQKKVPAAVQKEQTHLEPEKKENHPRQGNYKPDDVSMEKMFYFGSGGNRGT